jgi:alkyl hydroperoxide reductase subunit AhpC
MIHQMGTVTVVNVSPGKCMCVVFMLDDEEAANGAENVIQHVTVNNLNVGRSPEETLRILDALQTGELCACNRTVGGETL